MTSIALVQQPWIRLQMVCRYCRQVLHGERHDCIVPVRHPRTRIFLMHLRDGDTALADWNYEQIPERERVIIRAILKHARFALDA